MNNIVIRIFKGELGNIAPSKFEKPENKDFLYCMAPWYASCAFLNEKVADSPSI